MSRRVSELPTMSMSFRMARLWNSALDWVYPGGALVCVLCHRVIPPLTGQQLQNVSDWAATPVSLGKLICPFCLQEARGMEADVRVRNLRVTTRLQRRDEESTDTTVSTNAASRPTNVAPRSTGAAFNSGYGRLKSTSKPTFARPESTNALSEQNHSVVLIDVPVYSVYRYQGFVKHTIRPWKYDGALGLTEWFANGIVSVVKTRGLAGQVDFITPVPTSPARLHQRGYHHTLLLAKAVADACRLPVLQVLQRGHVGADRIERGVVDHDGVTGESRDTSMAADGQAGLEDGHALMLDRKRIQGMGMGIQGKRVQGRHGNRSEDTGRETQTAKSAKERRATLSGVFRVVPGLSLRGARVLLLDDVVTTGATMQACAEQLLQAGASSVIGIVIADVE